MRVKILNNDVWINGIKAKKLAKDSRTVLRAKNYVIKMDNENTYFCDECSDNKSGYEYQCDKEFDVWSKVKSTKDRKYFVPILKYGTYEDRGLEYPYVVQKYIEFEDNEHTFRNKKYQKFIDRISAKYNLEDLTLTMNKRNWALKNNEVIIFDYGC